MLPECSLHRARCSSPTAVRSRGRPSRSSSTASCRHLWPQQRRRSTRTTRCSSPALWWRCPTIQGSSTSSRSPRPEAPSPSTGTPCRLLTQTPTDRTATLHGPSSSTNSSRHHRHSSNSSLFSSRLSLSPCNNNNSNRSQLFTSSPLLSRRRSSPCISSPRRNR